MIPPHFIKLHILKIFSQHELTMTQQKHAIQRHSVNAWQGKNCYFSMREPEMKTSLQLFRHKVGKLFISETSISANHVLWNNHSHNKPIVLEQFSI